MTKVFLTFFTPKIMNYVRASKSILNMTLWERYRNYHMRFTHLNNPDMEFKIMDEFQHICETIVVLPKVKVSTDSLINIFRTNTNFAL